MPNSRVLSQWIDRAMPQLSRIFIYPIKSLDGIEVRQAKILQGGALEHDREFAIIDRTGKWVNGKRTAKVHQIRSQFHLNARIVTLSIQNQNPVTFHLDHGRSGISGWLSHYFGFPVTLEQNTITGFPDDPISPGPTLISSDTIKQVASWFPDLEPEDLRIRLRTNLEISDVPAFWEDRLYSSEATPCGSLEEIAFQIGSVNLEGVNPCQRCVVPTRDPISGEVIAGFQKTFVTHRKNQLPTWAAVDRFNHFYRLAVNTRIAPSEAGKQLQAGEFVVSID
ncbi:MOSC domain-containing protein [Phormidesmis priestleyi]